MKKLYLFIILSCLTLSAWSQENLVTVSGGYAFANIENTDLKPAGWRINGAYEFNPSQGPWAFGFAVGYIGLTATGNTVGSGTADYSIGTIPLYFTPRFMFGNDKIKGFIKGALGTQNSHLKRTGIVEISDNDWGFYGGGSAGLNFSINEMIFLNAEYELAWLSNTAYKDGLMNSIMLGIGVKF